MSEYDNFALGWLHPDGCEVVKPRKAWWQVGKERKNAPPPEQPDETEMLTELAKARLCADYPGIMYRRDQKRFVVQFRLNFVTHWGGAHKTLDEAITAHDRYVVEHDLPRPLFRPWEMSA